MPIQFSQRHIGPDEKEIEEIPQIYRAKGFEGELY